MLKNYCVIFDMDGVIFDSERACLYTWTETAMKYGIRGVREVFDRCIGTNNNQTRQIVEDAYSGEFGEGIADKLLSESSRLFHEKYDGGNLPIKDGVKEILEYLREKKVRCAVASSTRKAVVEAELRDAGLIDYFEEIVGGDAVKISKPDPEIYRRAMQALNVTPQECLYVGDGGSHELTGARDLGMQAVQCTWFSQLAYEPHIPCPLLPDFPHADTREDIIKFIDSLNS